MEGVDRLLGNLHSKFIFPAKSLHLTDNSNNVYVEIVLAEQNYASSSCDFGNLSILCMDVWKFDIFIESSLHKNVVIGSAIAIGDLCPHCVSFLNHKISQRVLVIIPIYVNVFHR